MKTKLTNRSLPIRSQTWNEIKQFSDAFLSHQTTLVYTNNEEKFFLHTAFARAPRVLSNNSYEIENNRSGINVLVLKHCCTTEKVSNFPRCSLFSQEISSDKKVNSEEEIFVKHRTNVFIALRDTCSLRLVRTLKTRRAFFSTRKYIALLTFRFSI